MKVLLFSLIVMLLAFTSQGAYAHIDHDKARFVAADGIDDGQCNNRFRPCKTLAYAAMQASKGDKILVAEGTYTLNSSIQSIILNDSMMPILGGFSRTDHFQVQNPTVNNTTIINAPAYLAESLYQKGFNAISDGKSGEAITRLPQNALTQQTRASTTCESGFADEFPCDNVNLLSQVPINQLSTLSNDVNDIWGHVDLNTQREYAIVGMNASVVVVDITTPSAPSVVGEVQGRNTGWRDIKVLQYYDSTASRWQAFAYSSSESEGFAIIDLNDLPNSVSLSARNRDDNNAHNIYVSNVDYTFNTAINNATPQLHLVGQDSNGGAFRSYNLDVPQTPAASFTPNGLTRADYTHDIASMFITDGRAQSDCVNSNTNGCTVMLDFNESEMRLWDHTLQNSTVELSSISYANVAYTHSGWVSEDKRYAFVHDEIDERQFSLNTRVMVFDISSLTNPVLAATWVSDNSTVDHNGYVRGNRYYISNYERGLTILDISDPTAPEQVGFFDTYPNFNSSNFNGAWGVYPFLPSGNIIVSDRQRGLFVLQDNTLNNTTTVGFAQSSLETAANTTLNLPVNKTGNDALTVNYEVIQGSADSSDVTLVSGELTWGLAETGTKNIVLDIEANEDDEPSELFFVRLFNPQGGGLEPGLGNSTIKIQGVAQVGKAELSTTSLSVLETSGQVDVEVTRQGGSEDELSISYTLESDTATENEDFEAQTGTLSWQAGDTSARTISVSLINDTNSEDTEQFSIVLTSDNADLLGSFTQTIVTIKDDESNEAPIVNAGDDFSALLRTSQSLDGTAVDPEGELTGTQWTQVSGEAVTIMNSRSLSASFTTPDNPTTLEFRLSATDEFGVESSDTVMVEVEAPASSTPADPPPVETPPADNVTPPANNSGGGGSTGIWLLISLAAFTAYRRRAEQK